MGRSEDFFFFEKLKKKKKKKSVEGRSGYGKQTFFYA